VRNKFSRNKARAKARLNLSSIVTVLMEYKFREAAFWRCQHGQVAFQQS